MKTKTVWKEKMMFTGEAAGNTVELDAKSPLGADKGLTPKELLPIAISGCSAMDVVALMKKHKQPLESFEVTADVEMVEKSVPTVFRQVALTFSLTGPVDPQKALEAVRLSQTKYCGVSAMLVKAAPIHYKVILNGEVIGTGEASFNS